MSKKQYIENAKRVILNRVKFHAPVVYDGAIDKRVLFENGIDVEKPIFKFDKNLNKSLLKAFEKAQSEMDFNLVLSFESLGRIPPKRLDGLSNCVLYSQKTSPLSLVEMINKLNINYQSSSNYNLDFKDEFFKIGEKILNPQFKDFALVEEGLDNFVEFLHREFVLNGKNYFCKLKNNQNAEKKVTIELNIPLKKGYYYFKKLSKAVVVENLLTQEKTYLNFLCKNMKFSYSNVDGLENSTFCCINVKAELKLKANGEEFVWFNFSKDKFDLKNFKQIEEFLMISHKKCLEMFDLRVKTKNAGFDQFFNFELPKKIWLNWINSKHDLQLEEKYLTYRKLFLRGKETLNLVNFKEIGIKEFGIFNGKYFKKIVVVKGFERFLKVGEIVFRNINGITNKTLTSKQPVCVCFGE